MDGPWVTLGQQELVRKEAKGLPKDRTICYPSPSTRPGTLSERGVVRAPSAGLRGPASRLWTVEAAVRFCIGREVGVQPHPFACGCSFLPALVVAKTIFPYCIIRAPLLK